MKHWVILFLLSLFSSKVWAQDCPEIHPYVSNNPKPKCMASLKVRDQGALGICYAHTASQLVDCQRYNHGYYGETSALMLSARTKAHLFPDDSSLERGNVCYAYELSLIHI